MRHDIHFIKKIIQQQQHDQYRASVIPLSSTDANELAYWLVDNKNDSYLNILLDAKKINLDSGKQIIDNKRKKNGIRTLLMKAVMNRDVVSTKILLQHGANPDILSITYQLNGKYQKQYPIEVAYQLGDAEIFLALATKSKIIVRPQHAMFFHLMDAVRKLQQNNAPVIDLQNHAIGNTGAKFIAAAMPAYTGPDCQLNLSHCEISNEGGIDLAQALKQTSKISKLNISNNLLNQETVNAVIESISQSTYLTAINVASLPINQEGIQLLSKFLLNQGCQLQQLIINKCQLTYPQASQLAQAIKSTTAPLSILVLDDNTLSNYGLVNILRALQSNLLPLKKITFNNCGASLQTEYAFNVLARNNNFICSPDSKRTTPLLHLSAFKTHFAENAKKVKHHLSLYQKAQLEIVSEKIADNTFNVSLDLHDLVDHERKIIDIMDPSLEKNIGRFVYLLGSLTFESVAENVVLIFNITNQKKLELQNFFINAINIDIQLNTDLIIQNIFWVTARSLLLAEKTNIHTNFCSFETNGVTQSGYLHNVSSHFQTKLFLNKGNTIHDAKFLLQAQRVENHGSLRNFGECYIESAHYKNFSSGTVFNGVLFNYKSSERSGEYVDAGSTQSSAIIDIYAYSIEITGHHLAKHVRAQAIQHLLIFPNAKIHANNTLTLHGHQAAHIHGDIRQLSAPANAPTEPVITITGKKVITSATTKIIGKGTVSITGKDIHLQQSFLDAEKTYIDATTFTCNSHILHDINIVSHETSTLGSDALFEQGVVSHVAATTISSGHFKQCKSISFYGDSFTQNGGSIEANQFSMVLAQIDFSNTTITCEKAALYAQDKAILQSTCRVEAQSLFKVVANSVECDADLKSTAAIELFGGKFIEGNADLSIDSGRILLQSHCKITTQTFTTKAGNYQSSAQLISVKNLVRIDSYSHLDETKKFLSAQTLLCAKNKIHLGESFSQAGEGLSVFSSDIVIDGKVECQKELRVSAGRWSVEKDTNNFTANGKVQFNQKSICSAEKTVVMTLSYDGNGKLKGTQLLSIAAESIKENSIDLAGDNVQLKASKKILIEKTANTSAKILELFSPQIVCEASNYQAIEALHMIAASYTDAQNQLNALLSEERKYEAIQVTGAIQLAKSSVISAPEILLNSSQFNSAAKLHGEQLWIQVKQSPELLAGAQFHATNTLTFTTDGDINSRSIEFVGNQRLYVHCQNADFNITSRLDGKNITLIANVNLKIDCTTGYDENGKVTLMAKSQLTLLQKLFVECKSVTLYGHSIFHSGDIHARKSLQITFGELFQINKGGKFLQSIESASKQSEPIETLQVSGGRKLEKTKDKNLEYAKFSEEDLTNNPPKVKIKGSLKSSAGEVLIILPTKPFSQYIDMISGGSSAVFDPSYVSVNATGEINGFAGISIFGDELWNANRIITEGTLHAQLNRCCVIGLADSESVGMAYVSAKTLIINASAYFNLASMMDIASSSQINSLIHIDAGVTSSYQHSTNSLLPIECGITVPNPKGLQVAYNEFDIIKTTEKMFNFSFSIDGAISLVNTLLSVGQLFFKEYAILFKTSMKLLQVIVRAKKIMDETYKLIQKHQKGLEVMFAECIPIIVTGATMAADGLYAYRNREKIKSDLKETRALLKNTSRPSKKKFIGASKQLFDSGKTKVGKLIGDLKTNPREMLQNAGAYISDHKKDLLRYGSNVLSSMGLMPSYHQSGVFHVGVASLVITGSITRNNAYNYSSNLTSDIGLVVNDFSNVSRKGGYVRAIDVFILGGDMQLMKNGSIKGMACSLIADTLTQESGHSLSINGSLVADKITQNNGKINVSADSYVKTQYGIVQHNKSTFTVGKKQEIKTVYNDDVYINGALVADELILKDGQVFVNSGESAVKISREKLSVSPQEKEQDTTQTKNIVNEDVYIRGLSNNQITIKKGELTITSDNDSSQSNQEMFTVKNTRVDANSNNKKPEPNLVLGKGVESHGGSHFDVYEGYATADSLLATGKGAINFHPSTRLDVKDVTAKGGDIFLHGLQDIVNIANAAASEGGSLNLEELQTKVESLKIAEDGHLNTRAVKGDIDHVHFAGKNSLNTTELRVHKSFINESTAQQSTSTYVKFETDNDIKLAGQYNLLTPDSQWFVKANGLDATQAHVSGAGVMAMEYEHGSVGGYIKPRVLQLNTNKMDDYHDLLSRKGIYSNVAPTEALALQTKQALLIDKDFKPEYHVSVTGTVVDINVPLNSSYNMAFKSTEEFVRTQKPITAANLHLDAKTDVHLCEQTHKTATGTYEVKAGNNILGDRAGFVAKEVFLDAGNDLFLRSSQWHVSNYAEGHAGHNIYLQGLERKQGTKLIYDVTKVISGAGEGHKSIGTLFFAENKVFTGATSVDSLGHNHVVGKQGGIELNAQVGHKQSIQTRTDLLYRKRTIVKKDVGYVTTFHSRLGENAFYSENGGLVTNGAQLLATSAQGKNYVHVKKNVHQSPVVLQEKTTVCKKYVSLFRSHDRSEHETKVHDVIYDSGTYIRSTDGEYTGKDVAFGGGGPLIIHDGNDIMITRSAENHRESYHQWSTAVNTFGSEFIRYNLTGNPQQAFMSLLETDPVLRATMQLIQNANTATKTPPNIQMPQPIQAGKYMDILAKGSNFLLHGYNALADAASAIHHGTIAGDLLQRYGLGDSRGFNPSIHFNLGHNYINQQYQTLNAAGIYKDFIHLHSDDGDVHLNGGMPVTAAEMKVHARHLFQNGLRVESSMSNIGETFSVGISTKGEFLSVGVGKNAQHSYDSHWENQQLHVGHLTLDLSEGWHLNAANATVRDLTIMQPLKIFDINSQQDVMKSHGYSIHVTTAGDVNASVNQNEATFINETSGVSVTGNISGFHVDQYNNVGGYVSVPNATDFTANHTNHASLIDESSGHSANFSGNLQPLFYQSNSSDTHRSPISTVDVGFSNHQYAALRVGATNIGLEKTDVDSIVLTNKNFTLPNISVPIATHDIHTANTEIRELFNPRKVSPPSVLTKPSALETLMAEKQMPEVKAEELSMENKDDFVIDAEKIDLLLSSDNDSDSNVTATSNLHEANVMAEENLKSSSSNSINAMESVTLTPLVDHETMETLESLILFADGLLQYNQTMNAEAAQKLISQMEYYGKLTTKGNWHVKSINAEKATELATHIEADKFMPYWRSRLKGLSHENALQALKNGQVKSNYIGKLQKGLTGLALLHDGIGTLDEHRQQALAENRKLSLIKDGTTIGLKVAARYYVTEFFNEAIAASVFTGTKNPILSIAAGILFSGAIVDVISREIEPSYYNAPVTPKLIENVVYQHAWHIHDETKRRKFAREATEKFVNPGALKHSTVFSHKNNSRQNVPHGEMLELTNQ